MKKRTREKASGRESGCCSVGDTQKKEPAAPRYPQTAFSALDAGRAGRAGLPQEQELGSQQSAATDSSRGTPNPPWPSLRGRTHGTTTHGREPTASLDPQSLHCASPGEHSTGAGAAAARTSQGAWRLPSIKAPHSQQHPVSPATPSPSPGHQLLLTHSHKTKLQAGPCSRGTSGTQVPWHLGPGHPSQTPGHCREGHRRCPGSPPPGVPARTLACLVNNDFVINIP